MSIKVDFNELLTHGYLDIDSTSNQYDDGMFIILDIRGFGNGAIFEQDIFLEDYFEDPHNPTETEKALLKLQKGIEIIYD